MESRLGQAYNETAFRYFLAMEREIAERSNHPSFLLLVSLRRRACMTGQIDPRVATQLFSGLWLCLRETDVIGWFRAGRVIGAVLTQAPDTSAAAISRLVHEKVRGALCAGLPLEVAGRIRLRVCQLPARPTDRS